jgi:hypothetical protein
VNNVKKEKGKQKKKFRSVSAVDRVRVPNVADLVGRGWFDEFLAKTFRDAFELFVVGRCLVSDVLAERQRVGAALTLGGISGLSTVGAVPVNVIRVLRVFLRLDAASSGRIVVLFGGLGQFLGRSSVANRLASLNDASENASFIRFDHTFQNSFGFPIFVLALGEAQIVVDRFLRQVGGTFVAPLKTRLILERGSPLNRSRVREHIEDFVTFVRAVLHSHDGRENRRTKRFLVGFRERRHSSDQSKKNGGFHLF